jgi:hypothetical protein
VAHPWRFVHAISAETESRSLNRLIGVSALDPKNRTIAAVLMTIEGLVVFAARWEGRLTVSRALPPFDNPDFAEGLMADIRLLLFSPAGPSAAIGRNAGGFPICRYKEKDGASVDVVVHDGRGWEINRYDSGGKRTRSATAHDLTGPAGATRVAGRMALTAYGRSRYRLTLELISAQPTDAS